MTARLINAVPSIEYPAMLGSAPRRALAYLGSLVLVLFLLASPPVAGAQAATKVPRIGYVGFLFPLLTNDPDLSAAAILDAYKTKQPLVEKRHDLLKNVEAATPMYLKSVSRIEAVLALHFVALLVHALLERDVRRAMARRGIKELPLYPEDRNCKAPRRTGSWRFSVPSSATYCARTVASSSGSIPSLPSSSASSSPSSGSPRRCS